MIDVHINKIFSTPIISIVTPSYNQVRFLENTIDSVINQTYQNIEYIVIDGGSTDGSLEVLKRRSAEIDYWVSEPDNGQSDAINKGLRQATGDVVCWLNSDDCFVPGALEKVANYFSKNEDCDAIVGDIEIKYEGLSEIKYLKGKFSSYIRLLQFWKSYNMHQPAIFWKRTVTDEVGLLDTDENLVMDYDYWLRIARQFRFEKLNSTLARVLHHGESKTGRDDFKAYHVDVKRRALEEVRGLQWHKRFYWWLSYIFRSNKYR